MLSRSAVLARTFAALGRQRSRLMSDHAHGHYGEKVQVATMNDLPVPAGSWQAAYNSKQTKYNIHLLVSVVFFIATCGYVYQAKIIDLNLPPRMKN